MAGSSEIRVAVFLPNIYLYIWYKDNERVVLPDPDGPTTNKAFIVWNFYSFSFWLLYIINNKFYKNIQLSFALKLIS